VFGPEADRVVTTGLLVNNRKRIFCWRRPPLNDTTMTDKCFYLSSNLNCVTRSDPVAEKIRMARNCYCQARNHWLFSESRFQALLVKR
jgi:hypothetical protein